MFRMKKANYGTELSYWQKRHQGQFLLAILGHYSPLDLRELKVPALMGPKAT